MVFTVRLRVLLWIILLACIQSVVNETVDMNTLSRIQKFFHFNYEYHQYAVAINVPKQQCRSGFTPRKNNFLLNDISEDVLPYINPDIKDPDINDVYIGSQLIAAGVHEDAHSEYLLMNPPKNSALTHLMNKNKDGCVVFYTLISPCINSCLKGKIIPGLDELNEYQGIKAFVYTHVFKYDQGKENLHEELKKIADRVPLYRCNPEGCILCGEPGSGKEVIDKCLTDEFSLAH